MSIKCAIVDDEAIAIAVIERLLNKLPDIEVVASCQSAVEAYDMLKKKHIDLLFLDVEMPELTGIDFLKTLHNPPQVIITSANKDFALDGFELNVLDYILKPVTLERLLKAIDKYENTLSTPTLKKEDISKHVNPNEYIYVKENKKMVKILIDHIEYLESIKDYVRIITTRKKVVTKQLLSYFEEKLPSDKFIRIHRSIIVALGHIESYSSSSVDVAGIELPIGRSYKDSVTEVLNNLAHL